jgi:hypothetical protein
MAFVHFNQVIATAKCPVGAAKDDDVKVFLGSHFIDSGDHLVSNVACQWVEPFTSGIHSDSGYPAVIGVFDTDLLKSFLTLRHECRN